MAGCARDVADIPVYILCYNNNFYVARMIDQLLNLGVTPDAVRIIDNASDQPTQRCLDTLQLRGIKVKRMDANHGHGVLYRYDVWPDLPSVFAYTDPDLQFHADMPRSFRSDLRDVAAVSGKGKAGLALDVNGAYGSDAIPEYLYGRTIAQWEAQHWEHRMPLHQSAYPPSVNADDVYEAQIDTTFAVYLKALGGINKHYDAVRVAGNFTCRHLPWYPAHNATVPPDELEYMYRKRGDGGCSTTGKHILRTLLSGRGAP